MSEEFNNEKEVVEAWEEFGNLYRHPLSSEKFAFYTLEDHYGGEDIIGFFKDTKDKWHTLNHGQWIHAHDSNDYSHLADLSEKEINHCILELQKNGHIMDNEEGRVYYIKKGKPAEDTGYKRECSGSHLDAAYLFKDSFVIDNKDDVIGDPDHDVYGSENITKNKLYKRQEDGSYKQIWESKNCIFQKEGFPDNVYFSGGSWRNPKMETCFIDGQAGDATKQKIDIAFKLEKLRQAVDPLQAKQQELKIVVGRKKLGKTADTKTGQVTDEHREIAKQQVEISKALIKAKREKEGKGS